MALVSPGVEVNVIDESFYTPSAAGTVPMIFVATAADKVKGSGAGVAEGTSAANQGRPYLITSQRELVETFGDPLFYSDNNGNMIHAGELNEYGLQTAYSLLGVTNRVYVCRADINLSKLEASATAPGGDPLDGTYWFDTLNTNVGVKEWNGASITSTNGQSFSSVVPTIIVETSKVVDYAGGDYTPKTSVGAVGDYALVAVTTVNRLWYKNNAGAWVTVGGDAWRAAWASIRGTVNTPSVPSGVDLSIDGEAVTTTGTTVTQLAADINGNSNLATAGVTAAAVDGALEIYTNNNSVEIDAAPTSDAGLLTAVGLTAAVYYAPFVTEAPHTSVPEYKATDSNPRPTGSIWMQTTAPNSGATFTVKQWNDDTKLWSTVPAPLYDTAEGALAALDKTGGGKNLAIGDLYVNVDVADTTPIDATYKIFRRAATGATKIQSAKIVAQLAGASVSFTMAESIIGSATLSSAKTISFSGSGSSVDADDMAGAINSAGFVNITASVDAQNRVVISHAGGGEMKLVDTSGDLAVAGFAPYDVNNASSTTINLDYAPGTDGTTNPEQYVASNWRTLSYTADDDAPTALATQGELWYSSVVDEVDILYHNGTTWVGYADSTAFPTANSTGPLVTASEPKTQSDGSALVAGDLWIDTADIENFPTMYRWTAASEWQLIDKADQTTENGVLFADARWADAGADEDAASIEELMASNYLDPDAPDPALYPKGMLLWNLRRSGFNVKRFERNYVDVSLTNDRSADESMASYYPHRWVTDSGNQPDGSGTFGRHAQRKSVTQSLQAELNSNTEIRDEESRQFNLIATPGYPELIGEMISLNYDRRLTAFVVGDTPFRLTPDATSLNEWATNVNLAVEDNDRGLVSRDEYLGIYYPAGFTSDNEGNNVVVPPSYMALRTLVLNDQVAYPWFAPAGTRRGGVTNASATGFVTSEGEFKSVALNTGQRDTLYTNAINPITFISGSGLVVFGQKTRARNASALDRINVARLTVYMRGQLELLARPYLFEPNDKITRDQVKAAADAFLLELVSLRAIYDYVAVCDESNNTPARIDRNELHLDIAIEPVKAIEFIYIPLRIKNTGEIAALG